LGTVGGEGGVSFGLVVDLRGGGGGLGGLEKQIDIAKKLGRKK